MSRREIILASLVGALLVAGLGFFAWSRIRLQFDLAEAKVNAQRQALAKSRDKADAAREAQFRLKQLGAHSLPRDLDEGKNKYFARLKEALVETGMSDVTVTSGPWREVNNAFQQVSFTIQAKGQLDQLVAALHRFYSAGYLHRIKRMNVAPLRGKRDLDLSISVEAIRLPTAAEESELPAVAFERLAHGDVAAYQRAILYRNLFGPANNPPRFSRLRSEDATLGKTFFCNIEAEDADPLDELTYELVSGPKGMTLSDSGRITWRPSQTGDYQVEVAVTDNGLPPKRTTGSFEVEVRDPPPPRVVVREKPEPPKPKFDESKHTFLTAIVEIGGRPEAWLSIRTADELLKLHVGEEISIGSVVGVIESISETEITIRGDDRRLTVKLGHNLGEGESITLSQNDGESDDGHSG